MEFRWHANKATENFRKHRVTFEEAVTVFNDPLAKRFHDSRHSEVEYREFIIGESEKRRLLLVVYAPTDDFIRIVSARKATRSEKALYEES